ncbi:MAG: potassium channel family protein [Chloroflexota bacterium]
MDRPEREARERERLDLQERLTTWLDLPLALLSLVWAGLVVAQLALDLPPELAQRVNQADIAIWVVFAAVFILEFLIAPNKRRYLRLNVLSAVSVVLPFARAVRVLRLARVLRSLSLVRVTLIANRATAAVAELFSRQRFHYLLALTVVITLLSAAAAYFFERDAPGTPFVSFGEAVWWGATLVTTINVGIEPVTLEGRVLAILLRVFGVGVFGYVAGSIASYLVSRAGTSADGREAELHRLSEEVAALRRELARPRPPRERDPDQG